LKQIVNNCARVILSGDGEGPIGPTEFTASLEVSDHACTRQKSEDEALIRLYRGYDGGNMEFHWVDIVLLSLVIVLILHVDFLNIPSLIS